jgi:hypothetical protein
MSLNKSQKKHVGYKQTENLSAEMVFHIANIDIFTMLIKALSSCDEMRSRVAGFEALLPFGYLLRR